MQLNQPYIHYARMGKKKKEKKKEEKKRKKNHPQFLEFTEQPTAKNK